MGAVQAAVAAIVLLMFLGIGVIVFDQVMGQAYTVAQQANDIQAVNFIEQAKNEGYTLLLLMIVVFGMDAAVILAVMRMLASE
jgi:hypothetical protein